jgi:hypothetical protein
MNVKLTKEKIYQSLLVIVAGLLVIYFIYARRGNVIPALLYVAAALAIVSLIVYPFARAVVWGWFMLAKILGYIVPNILLTSIYFFFLTPIAVIYRLLSKNPLHLKNTGESMYITRDHSYNSKDLENIW